MAVEVVMPRLGWGGEDGSLVEWIKKDGEPVKAGEVVCTVEGDKAVNEVESLDNGVLRIPPDSPAPGVKVPVGTVLAYLVGDGELAPFEKPGATPGSRPGPARDAPSRPESVETESARGVDRPADDRKKERDRTAASAFVHGFLSTMGAGASAGSGTVPPTSPRARRVAAELGVDLVGLAGTGRSGRVVERDVRAAFAAATEERAASAGATEAASEAVVTAASTIAEDARPTEPVVPIHDVPMGKVRRVIARRMADSARTAAPVTLTTEADATELVGLREQLKRDRQGTILPIPSYNDFLARAAALALEQHPDLNVSLQNETMVYHATANIAIAVDTERGLLAPVLHDVGNKSLQQVARESAPLIERARRGRASSDDLSGATFTITNLGMYEIDAFTPIVNLPECAILGIGRVVAKPVVVDEALGTIGARKMLTLSLTFDHRLVDGAPAARCLQSIKRLVERPTLLI